MKVKLSPTYANIELLLRKKVKKKTLRMIQKWISKLWSIILYTGLMATLITKEEPPGRGLVITLRSVGTNVGNKHLMGF